MIVSMHSWSKYVLVTVVCASIIAARPIHARTGDALDPTEASALILEKLKSGQFIPQQNSEDAPEPAVVLPKLKLKGMILRNSNQGIAILSFGSKEKAVVPLDRGLTPESQQTFQLDGKQYSVVDFCPHYIKIRCLQSNEIFFVY